MADKETLETMQESWVDVQEQSEKGTLDHTSSKEEMRQLLASAVSEEEELSDSDVVYQVTFKTSAEPDEDSEEEPIQVVPPIQTSYPGMPKYDVQEDTGSSLNFRGICSSLTFIVPVIILTHLAVFGIGYFLGQRWSAEPSVTVMKMLHV